MWRSHADKAIDWTLLGYKEIKHCKTIVAYVNMHITLPNCYILLVLPIESIQVKPTLKAVY